MLLNRSYYNRAKVLEYRYNVNFKYFCDRTILEAVEGDDVTLNLDLYKKKLLALESYKHK